MKKPVILLLLLIGCLKGFSQCSATAATNGASFGNDASIGTLAWSNPADATLPDNIYTTAGQFVALGSPVQTNYLTATNFGFAIPAGAAICGIEVQIQRHATGLIVFSSIKDNSVKIIKNGTITGSEQSAAAAWPGADAYNTFGGPANQWGTAWTAADINAPNFGVAISAKLSPGLAGVFLTAEIDHISITVYYDFLLSLAPPHTDTLVRLPNKKKNEARVYLNAASHHAIMQCSEAISSMQLFDTNLRAIQTMHDINGNKKITVSTLGLPPGMYVARLCTKTNQVYTAKLMVW